MIINNSHINLIKQIHEPLKQTEMNKIGFKNLENDTIELNNEDIDIENEDKLETNRIIHREKIYSSILAASLSCIPPFCLGVAVPMLNLFIDPKKTEDTQEAEKRERIRQARFEASLMASIPFVGLIVPLIYMLTEDPEKPKPLFMNY
ncbi:MAG: hypothetical protein WCK67_12995 [bacterium]